MVFKNRHGYCLAGLLLMIVFFSCQEDTIEPELFGSVFGEVLMEDENIAIEMATISTNPPTSSIFSDASGRFVLEDIPVGTYSLRAEKNGFLTQVSTVAVFDDKDASVIIRMAKDSLENFPPMIPMNVLPGDGADNQTVDLLLEWTATDLDEADVLTYDVLLFNADQSQSIELISATTDTTYALTGLEYGTNYFWQVIVDDGRNEPVFSEVWGFRTESFPDHRFVFARSENGKYDIYSSDMAGNAIRLTDNAGSNWRPRMNPNRTKIAYISNVGIDPQIYVMDRDGKNSTMVTSIPISGANQFELDFCWSPDGTRILYMENSRLYTINADGTGLTNFVQAPFGFTFAECDWTAQGNKIAARTVGTNIYNSNMFTFDQQGNYTLQFFSNIPGGTGGPMFSIDGNVALYTHDITGFEAADGRQLDAHVFTKDLTTNVITDLSYLKEDGTNDFDPRYSPDGSKIIFMNTNNDGISPKNIWIMNLDGTGRNLLFENAEMPEWK